MFSVNASSSGNAYDSDSRIYIFIFCNLFYEDFSVTTII
jgi:hypothetical protein